jgi:5-methylcytosine-specific restriction protein A
MKKSKNKLRVNPSRLGTPGERITKVASWRDDKRGSTARGYNYEWQLARLEFLALNPLCAMCYPKGTIAQARIVDHIEPHNGDPVKFWDRTNWQGLCLHCHNAIKQRMERAKALGSFRVKR